LPVDRRYQVVDVPSVPVALSPSTEHASGTRACSAAMPTTAAEFRGPLRTTDSARTVPVGAEPVQRNCTVTHELPVSRSPSQNVPSARSIAAGFPTLRPNWSFPPLWPSS
jgi:hypothetical protein